MNERKERASNFNNELNDLNEHDDIFTPEVRNAERIPNFDLDIESAKENCEESENYQLSEDEDEIDISQIIAGNPSTTSNNQLTVDYGAEVQHWLEFGLETSIFSHKRRRSFSETYEDVKKIRMSASMKTLDTSLYNKLVSARNSQQSLNGRFLRCWALEIAKLENIAKFKASSSWLSMFIIYHNARVLLLESSLPASSEYV
ncbi:hypothetical protein SNEBB_003011 [Seison nebaliae]|nr:hypothetical protein SNEBB_003011 [Seison nebaliae]